MNFNKVLVKLNYFDQRMKANFKVNGFSSLPIHDDNEMAKIIESSEESIKPLFIKCFGEMGSHLLDKYFTCRGNIFEFYGSLDSENKDLFVEFDW